MVASGRLGRWIARGSAHFAKTTAPLGSQTSRRLKSCVIGSGGSTGRAVSVGCWSSSRRGGPTSRLIRWTCWLNAIRRWSVTGWSICVAWTRCDSSPEDAGSWRHAWPLRRRGGHRREDTPGRDVSAEHRQSQQAQDVRQLRIETTLNNTAGRFALSDWKRSASRERGCNILAAGAVRVGGLPSKP